MFFSVRTAPARWLRLGLAVLALVATHVNVATAAFGTTCARTETSSVLANQGDAAKSITSLEVESASRLEAQHDSSSQSPVPLAAVLQCSTGVSALIAVVSVSTPVSAWDSAALPLARQLRPPSLAPPPPFRPPRQA